MTPKTKKKLGLIADSACDLPFELIEKYGITFLPIPIFFPNETRRQYVDITTDEFFKKLAEENVAPTTGVPPPVAFKKCFDEALEKAEEAIMLTLSADLSGLYSSTVVFARQMTNNKVTVVDGRSATLPHGLIVLKTARMIEEGLTKEEILEKLQKEIIPNTRLNAYLGTIKYLKRSGRIDALQHIVGELLHFKPLIKIDDGKIISPGRVRGEEAMYASMKKLGEKLIEELTENETLVVGHSQNLEKAEELAKYLKGIAKKKLEILIWEIGPAIGVHVGPGAIGLVWVGKADDNWALS